MTTVLSPSQLTLADWTKRQNPNGTQADIVNLLSQNNEILQDMQWIEGNLPTGHKTTLRTSLPAATWRLLNYGVQPSKSTTAQITDTCGMLEAYAQVDKKLADLNGNTGAFRLSEDKAFLEGMNQTFAKTLFYGDQNVNPQQITGFAPRYNAIANATQAGNIIDMGGTGSTNASMWIITWGTDTVHGIFPKGMIAGLKQEDVTTPAPLSDGNGGLYQGYRTHYQWDCGLTVRDWRYVVRLANIDVTLLGGGSSCDLIKGLIRGLRRLPTAPSGASPIQMIGQGGEPSMVPGQTVIYCNRTISTWLDIQASYRTNMFLKMDEFAGKPVLTFRGIPIRNVDQLLDTESRIV